MKKSDYVVAVVLVLVIAVAAKYFYPQEPGQPGLGLLPETGVQQARVEPQEPAIRYPVPPPAPVETTPARKYLFYKCLIMQFYLGIIAASGWSLSAAWLVR